MASDTANSPVEPRKKHRRSAEDESGESSKRRKHHRHRHHRHRSKKHDAEDSNLVNGESAPNDDFPPPASIANSIKSDYDMEEGEIVEEDNQSPGAADDENAESNQQGINTSDGRDTRVVERRGTYDDFLTDEELEDKGNIVLRRRGDDSKLKDYSDERSSSISLDRVNGFAVPFPKSDEEKHHISRGSLSGENYRDDDRKSSKSSSHDSRRWERSRSRSRSVSISTHFHGKVDKYVDDPYDGTLVRRSRGHRYGDRDPLRGDEARDSNIYSESTGSRDRHCTVEGKQRDRERMDRDLRREKDRYISSYRDRIREREYETQQVKDKEPERVRDREREKNRVRDRELEEYREKDTDSNRNREKEQRSRRGRVVDMDRERESSRGRSWDRGTDWDRERAMGRDGSRDGAREKRSRERGREDRDHETERTRDGRDSYRDRGRDTESDRLSRHHKYDSIDARRGERDNLSDNRHDEYVYHRDWPRTQTQGASLNNDSVGGDEEKLIREEEEQEDYQEKISLQLADQEEEDINRVKEKSRKIQQAILEKYKTQSSGQVQPQTEGEQKDYQHGDMPGESAVRNDAVPEKSNGTTMADDGYAADPLFRVGNSPVKNGISAVDPAYRAGGLGEGTPKSERSTDMFCDDIFGDSPVGVRKQGKGDGLPIERSGLHDNWDDAEGYYSYRFGELLDGRYEITAAHGKGVFSTVVRAKDLKSDNAEPDEVAIKIIRNNETMFKAGQSELVILKKLAGADPDNKRHCVRFMSSFKYRNHLCLVFESLHKNLREILKKYGRNVGLKLTAVRVYAKQLFISLKHLRNCGVLHCDIKPDNMLVNSTLTVLKLCDFGNAMFAGKNEITPYLVSRFYRAPEIILGLPYDHPMDIWSVGCCLFELYSGKVLFPGATNNDMLRLHMELKGPFPKKMLRKGAFIDQHFDQDLNFLASEEDPVTKKAIKRIVMNIKPKDIGTIITGSAGEDPKMLANFKDLLDKIFVLDPDKRMTVSQALNHPFITGK